MSWPNTRSTPDRAQKVKTIPQRVILGLLIPANSMGKGTKNVHKGGGDRRVAPDNP
jgi:hypothetical protein